MSKEIKPYSINVSEAALEDLQTRLKLTRWTNELPGVGQAYGIPLDYVKKLVKRWQNDFDWRALEKQLNAYPQFTTEIDGQNIHFIHVKSKESGATPLILTHGWPMSILEYVNLIGPLTDPVAHGGKPEQSFDVVIPSIPGFGFSGSTTEAGWNSHRIAKAWTVLMERLGYKKYGVHGNDAGAIISPEVGRYGKEHVLGVHVNQIFSFPSGDPAEFAGLDEEDMKKVQFLQWFWENMGAFNKLQSSAPQTLSHALADSPVGQLAWSSQLFGESVEPDYILGNVAIYWFTNTSASTARLYYEDAHVQEKPTEPTTMPLGLSNFAQDFQSIRPFAERDHKNIVFWKTHDRGGHNASQDVPELLVSDLREFFAQCRA